MTELRTEFIFIFIWHEAWNIGKNLAINGNSKCNVIIHNDHLDFVISNMASSTLIRKNL